MGRTGVGQRAGPTRDLSELSGHEREVYRAWYAVRGRRGWQRPLEGRIPPTAISRAASCLVACGLIPPNASSVDRDREPTDAERARLERRIAAAHRLKTYQLMTGRLWPD